MALFGTTTDPDRERWEKLSQIVTLGLDNFRKTGRALKEIRDSQLYRFEFTNFEHCCRSRWKISPQHAGRLIDAAELASELEPTGSIPVSERQIRPLRELPKEERAAAWTEAAAEGATPEAIEQAVRRRRPKKATTPKPIRFRVPGATVIITPNKKFHGIDETIAYVLRQMDESKKNAA